MGMLPNMDWQETAALAIVAATATAFVWRRMRPRKFSFQRDTHCGCTTESSSRPPSMILQVRKGEQPKLTVKMR
jgi:hypothetical protein